MQLQYLLLGLWKMLKCVPIISVQVPIGLGNIFNSIYLWLRDTLSMQC